MKIFTYAAHKPTNNEAYHLIMPDDALRNVGIYRGDILWAAPQKKYHDGDIVAVQIGRRIYVRRAFNGGKYLFLEADSPAFLRLSIERDTPGIRLLGKIIRALPATA